MIRRPRSTSLSGPRSVEATSRRGRGRRWTCMTPVPARAVAAMRVAGSGRGVDAFCPSCDQLGLEPILGRDQQAGAAVSCEGRQAVRVRVRPVDDGEFVTGGIGCIGDPCAALATSALSAFGPVSMIVLRMSPPALGRPARRPPRGWLRPAPRDPGSGSRCSSSSSAGTFGGRLRALVRHGRFYDHVGFCTLP